MAVRVQHEDFDAGAEIARLRANNPKVGAVASFIGIVRDFERRRCGGLDYARALSRHDREVASGDLRSKPKRAGTCSTC